MNIKTILKTSVAAAALMAVAAPTMAQSNFETGQPKVKLKLYGQVNKAIMWGDDGQTSRTLIVDNQAQSSTRIGFTATAPVNADFSFGGQFEAEFASNANSGAAGVNINNGNYGANSSVNPDNTSGNQTTFVERIAEVTMNHKRFGKISLGQGVMASDGSSEANLSGTTLVIGQPSAGYLGGTYLYDNTAKNYTASTLGKYMGVIDPASRDDRVRYDTPRIMGFAVAAGFASGGEGDVGATYDNKIGQFKINGRIGYWNTAGTSTTVDDEIAGSLAVLHDSGVNGWFTMGNRNHKEVSNITYKDGEHIGGGVGYIAKIFGVGPTAFGVDYYVSEGIERTASTGETWEAATWGIGMQQEFSDIGTSAYLGYRNFDVDAPSTSTVAPDDVNVVIAGVRVQF